MKVELWVVGGMTIRSLITQTVGVGLLLLTGCETPRNMRDDLLRLTSSQPAQKSQSAKSVASTRPRTTPPASTTDAAAVAATGTSDQPPALPAATFGRTAGTPRRDGQSGALTCRQERDGTACHARRANQRGGPPPR